MYDFKKIKDRLRSRFKDATDALDLKAEGGLRRLGITLARITHINMLNREGLAPLHCSIRDHRAIEETNEHVIWGADVNLRTSYGWTPLMLVSMTIFENPGEFISLLTRYGADVNAETPYDEKMGKHTALSIAVGRQNIEAVRVLLAKKANPSIARYRNRADNEPLLKEALQIFENYATEKIWDINKKQTAMEIVIALIAANADATGIKICNFTWERIFQDKRKTDIHMHVGKPQQDSVS